VKAAVVDLGTKHGYRQQPPFGDSQLRQVLAREPLILTPRISARHVLSLLLPPRHAHTCRCAYARSCRDPCANPPMTSGERLYRRRAQGLMSRGFDASEPFDPSQHGGHAPFGPGSWRDPSSPPTRPTAATACPGRARRNRGVPIPRLAQCRGIAARAGPWHTEAICRRPAPARALRAARV
jgi:hypothetical protein